jgi:hypothetical protein
MLASPLASADIYKCPTDKSAVKYQNFPCHIDSIGSTATAPAPADKKAGPNGFGKIDLNDPKALAELREWRLKQRPDHPTGKLFFEEFPEKLDNIYTRFTKIQDAERLKQLEPVDPSVLDNPLDPR